MKGWFVSSEVLLRHRWGKTDIARALHSSSAGSHDHFLNASFKKHGQLFFSDTSCKCNICCSENTLIVYCHCVCICFNGLHSDTRAIVNVVTLQVIWAFYLMDSCILTQSKRSLSLFHKMPSQTCLHVCAYKIELVFTDSLPVAYYMFFYLYACQVVTTGRSGFICLFQNCTRGRELVNMVIFTLIWSDDHHKYAY